MKKIALALTLVSGLYLTGKAKAEGVDNASTNPDSSKFNTSQVAELEAVSLEAGAVAEVLLSNPVYASRSQREDQLTTRAFEMELISNNAAKAAEEIFYKFEE